MADPQTNGTWGSAKERDSMTDRQTCDTFSRWQLFLLHIFWGAAAKLIALEVCTLNLMSWQRQQQQKAQTADNRAGRQQMGIVEEEEAGREQEA